MPIGKVFESLMKSPDEVLKFAGVPDEKGAGKKEGDHGPEAKSEKKPKAPGPTAHH